MSLFLAIVWKWGWNLVRPYAGWLAGIAGIIVAVAAIYFRGKSQADLEGQIKTKQETIDAYKEHAKIETSVAGKSDPELDSLLAPWTHKE